MTCRGRSSYFNSIKVQLEPQVDALLRVVGLEFQFHKGTIRTLLCPNPDGYCLQFQFHKGTIRTPYPCIPSSTPPYFNSIKVQLEPDDCRIVQFLQLFQFHKGTIRTISLCLLFLSLIISIP